MKSFFPFLIFVLIGVSLTLFFRFFRRTGENSGYKTENIFLLILLSMVFLVDIAAQFMSFSSSQKSLSLFQESIPVSFLLYFITGARLYGAGGTMLRRGPAMPIYQKHDHLWVKWVIRGLGILAGIYFIAWIIPESISRMPGRGLSVAHEAEILLMGLRAFLAMTMFFIFVEINRMWSWVTLKGRRKH